jgi:hypothetical protein
MNTSALVGYEDKLAARIGQLVNALEKHVGSEVDISEWLSCLSYVMLVSAASSVF